MPVDIDRPERYMVQVLSGKPIVFEIVIDAEACLTRGYRLVQVEDHDLDDDMLMRIVEAQGGRFRPEGLFRFDPILAESGIRGCPNCGNLWVSRVEQPFKCQVCQTRLGGRKFPRRKEKKLAEKRLI